MRSKTLSSLCGEYVGLECREECEQGAGEQVGDVRDSGDVGTGDGARTGTR